MWFEIGEKAVINSSASKGLPNNVGDVVTVLDFRDISNYDYTIEFINGTKAFIKENELSKLNNKQKKLIEYIFVGNKVLHKSNELVEIVKVDYINHQAEVEFVSGGTDVVRFDSLKEIEKENVSMKSVSYFEQKGQSLGKLVDSKQDAYGDSISKTSKLMRIFLEDYREDDGYFIPEELLDHILLQVRIIDKQNRIFSNPKADKMNESPYDDISGYGLLGGRIHNS